MPSMVMQKQILLAINGIPVNLPQHIVVTQKMQLQYSTHDSASEEEPHVTPIVRALTLGLKFQLEPMLRVQRLTLLRLQTQFELIARLKEPTIPTTGSWNEIVSSKHVSDFQQARASGSRKQSFLGAVSFFAIPYMFSFMGQVAVMPLCILDQYNCDYVDDNSVIISLVLKEAGMEWRKPEAEVPQEPPVSIDVGNAGLVGG